MSLWISYVKDLFVFYSTHCHMLPDTWSLKFENCQRWSIWKFYSTTTRFWTGRQCAPIAVKNNVVNLIQTTSSTNVDQVWHLNILREARTFSEDGRPYYRYKLSIIYFDIFLYCFIYMFPPSVIVTITCRKMYLLRETSVGQLNKTSAYGMFSITMDLI